VLARAHSGTHAHAWARACAQIVAHKRDRATALAHACAHAHAQVVTELMALIREHGTITAADISWNQVG
jgi:hypothetical protein